MVFVVIVLLSPHSRTPSARSDPTTSESSSVGTSFTPVHEIVEAVEEPPKLPRLAFVAGSVEEACGLNEYVPYHYDDTENPISWPQSPFNAEGDLVALDVEACSTALANHLSTINPYLWSQGTHAAQFAFLVLDEPLTFGRIFADPKGDLARVQEALSRPECRLKNGTVNWELSEECHAEAFLNYALINRFCFHDGVNDRKRTYYWEEDNPTPEQDRSMWKQYLEDQWVEGQCEALDPTLELTAHQPELYESIMSFKRQDAINSSSSLLIELAARLGDDAAGLTKLYIRQHGPHYPDQGYKFGRLSGLLDNPLWEELQRKAEPSPDRLLQTMRLLSVLDWVQIEFDWEWLVEYLCTPPYDEPLEEDAEPKSCRTVIDELYSREDLTTPILEKVNQFTHIATEFDVYD